MKQLKSILNIIIVMGTASYLIWLIWLPKKQFLFLGFIGFIALVLNGFVSSIQHNDKG